MGAQQVDEITALIIAWDEAPFEGKRNAKIALDAKFRSFMPEATQEEIEHTIQHFRNRQVKEAKARQRREDTPKVQPEK
jgi:hypothetical protein